MPFNLFPPNYYLNNIRNNNALFNNQHNIDSNKNNSNNINIDN